MKLSEEVVHFFHTQGFTIVTTVDEQDLPHNSCKGIVEIDASGRVYLLDLYHGETAKNLRSKPQISVTAVDEHSFRGFSLKGRAKIAEQKDMTPEVVAAWEKRVAKRITQRVLKNISGIKGHRSHPEALLPEPKYMIVMEVEEVIDLTPGHLK
ncbi:MAG: pyridoxamine 5'-phosphate oxidase family protein [Candidatus Omnitrophota bacterium]